MSSLLLGVAIASTLTIADVPEGVQVPDRQPVQNATSGACANQDVGATRFDVNGVCIYSLGEHGWFYLEDGKAYGATCSLSDKWCEGFATKEQAVEASKK